MTTNTDAFKEAMEAIEDYGKWEELCSLAEADDREKHGGMDACKTKKRAARSRLGSIYREQQQEIERRKEINHALVESNGLLIEESIKRDAALSSLERENEEQAEALALFREEQSRDKAEIERLRNLVPFTQRIVT